MFLNSLPLRQRNTLVSWKCRKCFRILFSLPPILPPLDASRSFEEALAA